MRLRLIGVAGAALAAVAALTPLAASAAEGGAIFFIGATSSLTPVLWQGGGGSYGFTTAGHRCVEVEGEVAPGDIETEIDTNCREDASGTYNNIVCGTGSTGGGVLAMGDSGTDTNSDGEVSSFNYGINFVGTIGILRGTQLPELDGGTGPIVGVVQINGTPTPPQPGAPGLGTCVTSFNVETLVGGGGAN